MKILDLRPAAPYADRNKDELIVLLDEEVERFSKWMENCPDVRARGALSRPERALLKTYLVQKLKGGEAGGVD